MYRWPDGTSVTLLADGRALVRGGVCLNVEKGASAAALALASMGSTAPLGSEPFVPAQTEDLWTTAVLKRLGQGFAWQLPAAARGAAPLRRLHELAARMRVFTSLRHLPLLPESALALSLRIEARLPAGAQVYIPDDHLLLGLALADRGFTVAIGAAPAASTWLRDLVAGFRPEAGGDLQVVAGSVMPAGFDLVVVDTLTAPDAFAHAPSSAPGTPFAFALALVHPMWRAHIAAQVSSSTWAVEEEFHEIAARLHPGFFLSEFASDAWLLRPRTSLQDSDSAVGRCPSEFAAGSEDRTHGCAELHGLASDAFTPARLDEAIATATLALDERPLWVDSFDDDDQLVRCLSFPQGGSGVVCVRRREAVVAVDLCPWAPRDLTALVSALLLELISPSMERSP